MRPERLTTESPLAESSPADQRTEGSSSANGSAQSVTFIAEKSDTKFELTEAEKQHLDDLLAWQERSAKSLIRLGGTGEAPNDKLRDAAQ